MPTDDETPDPRHVALEHAAGGILRQPADAHLFGLAAELDVDDDGNVDPRQAAWLVERLAADKPYLVIPDALPAPVKAIDFDAGARPAPPPTGPSVSDRIRQVRDERHGRTLEEPDMLSPRFAPGRRPGADN